MGRSSEAYMKKRQAFLDTITDEEIAYMKQRRNAEGMKLED